MEKDLTTQEATKICNCCGTIKGLSDFPKLAKSKDGFDYYCKECRNKRQKENRQKRKNVYHAPTGNLPDGILDGLGPEYVGKPILRRTPLSAYTPRELMLELKKRRFVGHLEWIPPTPQPKKINLADIE